MLAGRPMAFGESVGKFTHGAAELWPGTEAAWKACAYKVMPILVAGAEAEGHADDIIHAHCLAKLMMNEPGTLILATGDGNSNDGDSNFPMCVVFALRAGWNVEIVSWARGTHSVYHTLHTMFPRRVVLRTLEPAHSTLCFEVAKKK